MPYLRYIFRVGAFALCSALISACSGGGAVPPTFAPSLGLTTAYGVTVTDFAMPTSRDLSTLAAMGIRVVRLDLGDSDEQLAHASAVIGAYRANGIAVIGIAPYVQKGITFSSAIVAQDSAWVAEIAPQLYALELQNEPDDSSQAQLTPANYVLLAKADAQSARQANPTIVISSGGTSGYDTTWLSQTVPSLLPYIDCVGVHPYQVDPADFAVIATEIDKTYGKPMCQTEWGGSAAKSAADIKQAADVSNGEVPIFVFFNLAELEANAAYQAAYSHLSASFNG